MKFIKFLDGINKTPSANGAMKPTTISPKLYPNPNKNQEAKAIAFILTVVILIISLVVNFILLVPPKETKVQDEVVPDTEVALPDQTPHQDGEPTTAYETIPICSITSTFKSWMDYRKITNISTRQWRYQQIATTDEYGFRKVGEYYMVAMAKQYGPVGTKYLITFSGGQQMHAIIGDIKGGTTCTHPDMSMIEMIVDSDKMPGNVKSSGNYNSMIIGTITEIRKVQEEIK